MKKRIIYIERKGSEFNSLEKVFRVIAKNLSAHFEWEFQQAPFGNRFTNILGNLLFFRRQKADLYHITGHVHYLALRLPPDKTVLTIHDLGFLDRKPGFRRWLLKKLFLDWPLRRLKFVTAISEQTKREIVTLTRCHPEKITVIEDPLVITPGRTNIKPFNAKKPTVLQIGTSVNKNVSGVARALRGASCHLRIIGRLNEHIAYTLAENEIEYSNGFELTDNQMLDEYRNADIVAYCSTREGFGLPVIEAQAMSRVVVTSDISPLKETSGGAAMLVDPTSVSSIREGFLRVIEDAGLRDKLVEAGYENALRFEPTMIAAQYEAYYKKVLAAVGD